ncbi:MAG: OmpA family protein [Rhodomicrobium sp.]
MTQRPDVWIVWQRRGADRQEKPDWLKIDWGNAVLVGRDADCDIVLTDPLVSRRHARIELGAHGVLAEDLGSKNGIKVGGRPTKREFWRADELLEIGDHLLSIQMQPRSDSLDRELTEQFLSEPQAVSNASAQSKGQSRSSSGRAAGWLGLLLILGGLLFGAGYAYRENPDLFTVDGMREALNNLLNENGEDKRRLAELERYRSEFFGRLRELLKNRNDIRVVGDRFIFQSEVLFDSGQADMTADGRAAIDQLATAIKELDQEIGESAPRINWVVQVDGHTDKRPISSSKFPSNLELSLARATSVVRYLISQGVPAKRLVPAGRGENQPLQEGDSEDILRHNRRIELRLTNG